MTSIANSLNNTKNCVKKLCNEIYELKNQVEENNNLTSDVLSAQYEVKAYGQTFYNPSEENGYIITGGETAPEPPIPDQISFNTLLRNGQTGVLQNVEFDLENSTYTITETGTYDISTTVIVSMEPETLLAIQIRNGNEKIGNYSGHDMMIKNNTYTFLANSVSELNNGDKIGLAAEYFYTGAIFTGGYELPPTGSGATITVHSWNFKIIKIDN